LEVLNEEGRFEYLAKGGMLPAGKDASEKYVEFSFGFVPFLTENPNGFSTSTGLSNNFSVTELKNEMSGLVSILNNRRIGRLNRLHLSLDY